MSKQYKFSSAAEKKIAAEGVGDITARIFSWGQFSMNQVDYSRDKKKIVVAAVDVYVEELKRIGFDIKVSEEGED
jgi:hypothetical protein